MENEKWKTISSGGGVPIPVKTYMGSMEMSVLICHIVYSVWCIFVQLIYRFGFPLDQLNQLVQMIVGTRNGTVNFDVSYINKWSMSISLKNGHGRGLTQTLCASLEWTRYALKIPMQLEWKKRLHSPRFFSSHFQDSKVVEKNLKTSGQILVQMSWIATSQMKY